MVEVIREIFYRLTYILPRPIMIAPDERGVLLRFGKICRVVNAGWVWIWPPIDEIEVMNVTEQVIDIRAQSVTTKDDVSLAISGAISYRIQDPQKALYNVNDADASLVSLSLGTIAHFVNQRTYKQCLKVDEISKEILGKIRERATNKWGLKIMRVFITDLSRHTVYRMLGDGRKASALVATENEEE